MAPMPSPSGSRTSWWQLLLVALVSASACRPAPERTTTLTIETPEPDVDADVYIDGHYVGQVSDLFDRPVRLAPGVHRVEIRKPGRFPVQRTVRIERDAPPEVVVSAELLEDPQ
jgi:hypothetical protein